MLGFEGIPYPYFGKVGSRWWAFVIAEKFSISPQDVKCWPAEDILETLAYIQITKPKGGKS